MRCRAPGKESFRRDAEILTTSDDSAVNIVAGAGTRLSANLELSAACISQISQISLFDGK
jgi:hypothetical protein